MPTNETRPSLADLRARAYGAFTEHVTQYDTDPAYKRTVDARDAKQPDAYRKTSNVARQSARSGKV